MVITLLTLHQAKTVFMLLKTPLPTLESYSIVKVILVDQLILVSKRVTTKIKQEVMFHTSDALLRMIVKL